MTSKLYTSEDKETVRLSEHRHDSPQGLAQIKEQINAVIQLLQDMRDDVANLRMVTVFASSANPETPENAHNMYVAAIGSIAAVITDVPEGMAKLGESLHKLAEKHKAEQASNAPPTSEDKIH